MHHTSFGSERAAAKRRCVAACETCRRRKERCNGFQPCGRCIQRKAEHLCQFVDRNDGDGASNKRRRLDASDRCSNLGTEVARNRITDASGPVSVSASASASSNQLSTTPVNIHDERTTRNINNHDGSAIVTTSPFAASGFGSPRMIQDPNGRHMFIGDSANLYFLQTIRRLVGQCIGPCAFVDDPLRYLMVEPAPSGESSHWFAPDTDKSFPSIDLEQARYLVRRYAMATNCVLDLFDEENLLQQLPAWYDPDHPIPCTISDALYYLVLAIGAQTSPSDQDALAAALFKRGRFLTTLHYTEEASLATVKSYALITFYLLSASRRNAAFMHLGIAVRAAYAIGLHRGDINSTFPREDFETRERVWKCLRILDLFMSASLGRPPSTTETRDTELDAEYSASTDLCAIFEKILNDVYARRMVSSEALANISGHHKRWAARFFRGLSADKILGTDVIEGGTMPNIGLLHVKEAYYWTIILLTRPFLTESISLYVAQAEISSGGGPAEPCTTTDTNRILVEACIDSAMRTIDLLKPLKGSKVIPKRLPFVINSVFISALVLGMAFFGDLYQVYSLERYLQLAHELLAHFIHDQIAQRNSNIVGYLREACEIYLEKRAAQNMDHYSLAVGSMFGQIHHVRSRAPTRPQTPPCRMPQFSPCGPHVLESQPGGSPASGLDEGDEQPGLCQKSRQQQQQEEPQQIQDELYDLMMDNNMLDMAEQPFGNLSPRTLWFQPYDEGVPMFSIVSDANVS